MLAARFSLRRCRGAVVSDEPIRLLVPFPPGAGADVVARTLAQKVTEVLSVQVIVDNRGGAGGTMGAAIAARAAPDGYTLDGLDRQPRHRSGAVQGPAV